ncbi:hypothetical protein N7509_010270 [Penicillium cosmopolitanum]|uniref:Uncharacterized protein n=1 Tax=Penicillium cosmopolitanum TaxID=1131564 RepID=A0A9W9VR52_9EURO|nr:uncharacterized protein N7509_010270 [Penicillium cosmopolitanum]KAJ5387729.1 hypothetical protein N7509_010270 [Penicillium cosmopolitanum]
MKHAKDQKAEKSNSQLVKEALESFTKTALAELEFDYDDLYSRKHHRKSKATDEQHENLLIVVEEVWSSLNASLEIDLSSNRHILLDKRSQDALKRAIKKDQTLTLDFVTKFIPTFWIKFVDQRKQQEKRDLLKKKRDAQKAKEEEEKQKQE